MPSRDVRYWAGIDGEGIGRNPHRYVLLAWQDAGGKGDYVDNRRGLSSKECLSFLLSAPHNARLCGYYLGYDWTMILKDLPNEAIYRLLRPELRVLPRGEGGGFSWVYWKGYALHYLAGMMRIKCGRRIVTVWDLGKFFQAPFVDSLEAWNISCVDPAAIAEMKGRRNEFTEAEFFGPSPKGREYCLSECRGLATLAADLESAHDTCGLLPQTWFGPGSTASVALNRLEIAEKRGLDHIPAAVGDAAAHAFFGGRFEHSMIGARDGCFGYDIVSAYPYQAYKLPCLEHGKWRRVTKRKELKGAQHAVIRFTVQDIGKQPWAPLPIRLSNGSIVFPRSGASGWCWKDEWQAAVAGWNGLQWGGEGWALFSECDCIPFREILQWFRERVALGKSQRGRILKLALNSIYGKLAQSVGSPQFASRIWAGMITSGTRAMLLRLLCMHRKRSNVLALATDGLYSSEDLTLPPNPLDPDLLGGWEKEEHGRMVFVRPGIYWSEQDETLRARGLGRKQLLHQREAVYSAIHDRSDRALAGVSTLFGGARATVYRNPRTGRLRRSRYYGQWHDIPARISLTPAPKRDSRWAPPRLNGIVSKPYDEKILSDDARNLKAIAEVFWAMKG